MFGHLPELGIILVIALIVFGPDKLPEVAANAGKMVREVRQAMDLALHPEDQQVPDDFSTYYYDSLERTGEAPPSEAGADPFEGWPGVAGPEAMDAESIPVADAGWIENYHHEPPETGEYERYPVGDTSSGAHPVGADDDDSDRPAGTESA